MGFSQNSDPNFGDCQTLGDLIEDKRSWGSEPAALAQLLGNSQALRYGGPSAPHPLQGAGREGGATPVMERGRWEAPWLEASSCGIHGRLGRRVHTWERENTGTPRPRDSDLELPPSRLVSRSPSVSQDAPHLSWRNKPDPPKPVFHTTELHLVCILKSCGYTHMPKTFEVKR